MAAQKGAIDSIPSSPSGSPQSGAAPASNSTSPEANPTANVYYPTLKRGESYTTDDSVIATKRVKFLPPRSRSISKSDTDVDADYAPLDTESNNYHSQPQQQQLPSTSASIPVVTENTTPVTTASTIAATTSQSLSYSSMTLSPNTLDELSKLLMDDDEAVSLQVFHNHPSNKIYELGERDDSNLQPSTVQTTVVTNDISLTTQAKFADIAKQFEFDYYPTTHGNELTDHLVQDSNSMFHPHQAFMSGPPRSTPTQKEQGASQQYKLSLINQPNPYQVHLDSSGLRWMDYFKNVVAREICIAPESSNFYLKVFLPMATVSPAIMYSIISWGAFHASVARPELEDIGVEYASNALALVNKNRSQMELKNETIEDSSTRLATFLILIGGELCRGDVQKWRNYLSRAGEIIKSKGGYKAFRKSRDLRWLIGNFTYHHVLSSTSENNGAYFNIESYDELLNDETYGMDPLHGCSKLIYQFLAEITQLAAEYREIHAQFSSPRNNSQSVRRMSIQEKKEVTENIIRQASNLEAKIDSARPNPIDMISLSQQEVEWQLSLFELLQLAVKIYLRQAVLRLCPMSLEIQCLMADLISLLDVTLGTPVEGGLCFSLFIAGINAVGNEQRDGMRARFAQLCSRYKARNVERSKVIVEEIWMMDPIGNKWIDYTQVIKNFGWNICFA